jgi:predicted permease
MSSEPSLCSSTAACETIQSMQVLRQATRTLLKMHLTAFIVLLTLAVGISANLIVFALVNAALIRPLPFSDPDRLVALDSQIDGKPAGMSWGEIQELERVPNLLDGAAAYTGRTWALTDHSGASLDVVLSGMVTPDFYRVLKPVPALGVIPASDNERVAVLSYALWQKRYRGDPNVTAQSLELNDVPYRIAGVLPRNFEFAIDGESPDLYIPLDRKDYCCRPDARGLSGIARIAPGVSSGAASEHLAALATTFASSQKLRQFSYIATPLKVFLVKNQKRTLLLLWLAVAVLGIISALNAGAVLLARSLRNVRQYAVKISLGAAFRHLLAEQIAQAVVLAVAASVLALGLTQLALGGLKASALFAPLLGNAARTGSLWDWRVFFFCATLALIAATFACVLPLVVLRKMAPEQVLRSHSGLSTSRAGRRLRTTLIVAQLALSVTLFSAATSFGHALYSLLTRDPGFRTDGVVTAGIGVPEARYDTDDKMIGFHQRVLEAIREIPGVSRAGFAAGTPVNPLRTRFLLDGSANIPVSSRPRADIAFVSPDMFQILDLALIRGRNFTAVDRRDSPFVAVVNQAFARIYLDAADPLKTGFRLGFYNGESMQPWSHFDLVGIVEDSRNRAIDTAPEPEIYISTQQVALEGGAYFLETTRDADSLQTELPAAIWRVDPLIQKVEPVQLRHVIEAGFSGKRITLFLFLGFGAIALGLAATGLGASISASVSESTKEIGIRSALGESRGSIAAKILQTAVVRTLLGTSCGIAGSVIVSRLTILRLDSNSSLDIAALAFNISLMLLIAIGVALYPIHRALHISPVEALRAE